MRKPSGQALKKNQPKSDIGVFTPDTAYIGCWPTGWGGGGQPSSAIVGLVITENTLTDEEIISLAGTL